jgi:hypothetical protein
LLGPAGHQTLIESRKIAFDERLPFDRAISRALTSAMRIRELVTQWVDRATCQLVGSLDRTGTAA